MKAIWPHPGTHGPGPERYVPDPRRHLPPLCDGNGELVTFSYREPIRVRRWCPLLTHSNGLIESDPVRETQVRRLAAMLVAHDVATLCELVQFQTYPISEERHIPRPVVRIWHPVGQLAAPATLSGG